MLMLLFFVVGIAIYGGSFIKNSIFGIPVFYFVILGSFIFYFVYLLKNKNKLFLNSGEKKLFLFECFSVLIVFTSFLGLNLYYISDSLLVSSTYIPRQAYFVVLLPMVFIFRDSKVIGPITDTLGKYGYILFGFVYILQMLVTKSFTIQVTTVFLLGWLTLLEKNKIFKYFMFALCMITPYAIGGELTNIIIRVVLFLCIFNRKFKPEKILFIVFIGVLIFSFVFPFFGGVLGRYFDVNSIWRLNYWMDEISQFGKTLGLGVGFGTSFASTNFVGEVSEIIGGPFGATAEYSVADKMFVTGPHNSFVALAFRVGIIGILLFILSIFYYLKEIKNYSNYIGSESIFIFYSSLFIISFNVGLESPYYLILFIFGYGMINFQVNKIKKMCENSCCEVKM